MRVSAPRAAVITEPHRRLRSSAPVAVGVAAVAVIMIVTEVSTSRVNIPVPRAISLGAGKAAPRDPALPPQPVKSDHPGSGRSGALGGPSRARRAADTTGPAIPSNAPSLQPVTPAYLSPPSPSLLWADPPVGARTAAGVFDQPASPASPESGREPAGDSAREVSDSGQSDCTSTYVGTVAPNYPVVTSTGGSWTTSTADS
jgi:hypothetical protein